MYAFNYERPASAADAARLAAAGAKILAGGQTLLASSIKAARRQARYPG